MAGKAGGVIPGIMTNFLKMLRILWITFGILFILWMLNSFRAQGFDGTILKSDQAVTVEETSKFIHFQPKKDQQQTGFIFFPGGMVQPKIGQSVGIHAA